MARKSLDDHSTTRDVTAGLRRRYVRRDLLLHGVLSLFVGVLAALLMPPPNAEWSVATQVAVAASIAVAVFALAFVLLTLREVLKMDGDAVSLLSSDGDRLPRVGRAGGHRASLLLGLASLTLTAGYGGLRFAGDGFASGVELLNVAFGALLGGALLGEYASTSAPSLPAGRVFLPAVELLVTYCLFGLFLAAAYAGSVAVAAVSGLLLVCSFAAIAVTTSDPFEAHE